MDQLSDSMITLILRFVGRVPERSSQNKEFVQREVTALKQYTEKFPENERDNRALEWISKYAVQYREVWEKRVVNEEFVSHRCVDCPLLNIPGKDHCYIHDRWVNLLTRYSTGEITSRDYVQASLELLAKEKENLKVTALKQ